MFTKEKIFAQESVDHGQYAALCTEDLTSWKFGGASAEASLLDEFFPPSKAPRALSRHGLGSDLTFGLDFILTSRA